MIDLTIDDFTLEAPNESNYVSIGLTEFFKNQREGRIARNFYIVL